MYSDLYFRQKKSYIPVLIAVLAVIGVTSFLTFYFSSSSTPTRASQNALIKREIVNPTTTQIGIFWETEEQTTGWVIYGTDPDKLTSTASDERDSSTKTKYKLHYALLKNLKPNTNYYYRIVNNNQITSDLDGSPFVIKTANNLAVASDAQPAYGKVALKSGSAATNTIVLIQIENTYPLLAITKATGEWLIPMQYIMGKADNTAMLLKPNDVVHIQIMNEDDMVTKVNVRVDKLSPLPQTVVLGNNYEFTGNQNDVLSATTSTAEERPSEGGIDILFPKQKAVIPGQKPLIKGTAVPGASIDIQLNSQPKFNLSTQANDRGDWIATVPKPLPPREYTLVMTTTDSQGQPVVIARTFTIAKSGEQVLGEATGEATPTIEPTAALPTTEPTIGVTATPEATKIPAEVTPIASTSATATPSAAPVITGYTGPSPVDGGPATGGNGFMYTLVSLGLLVAGAGVFFFL
jgi:hypothetical protein